MKRSNYTHKDAQTAWLGLVPEEWPYKRLRYCLKLNPSKQEIRHLPKDTELSFIPMEAVGGDGSLDLSNTRSIEDVENGYTYFRNDDVAIAKITPCFENGKGCKFRNLVHEYGFGTTELTVMRPRLLVPTYLYYLTISHRFRTTGIGLMQGSAGQKRVPDDYIRDYLIGLPSEAEQQAIVSILDRETSRIDALIQKKERLIELLKEKRIAIITQAVTKGLDPKAPMKDSGIEWLGVVPEHWIHVVLGRVCKIQGGYAFDSSNFTDDGWPIVQMSNLKRGVLDLSEAKKYPNELCPHEVELDEGDILIGMSGSIGETGSLGNYAIVSKYDLPCYLNQRVGKLDISSKLYGGLVYYLIQTTSFFEQVQQLVTGTAQFNISPSQLGDIWIALPPTTEQNDISTYLKNETSKIDNLMGRVEKSIALLREYRSSLINAAVTGKIDLRDAL